MKVLVAGDSISYGYGFPLEKEEPTIWPNRVAHALNASLVNVSIPGYDNSGIFINAVTELLATKYDLILIQLTSLDRIVVSPNMHCRTNLSSQSHTSLYDWLNKIKIHQFTKEQLLTFKKVLQEINGRYEHWQRLIRIITSLQNLRKLGHNIHIINGLLDWSEEDFTNKYAEYFKDILNYHSLPDSDIIIGLEEISQQLQHIDLTMWMNPFANLIHKQIDNAPLDNHPGSNSHKIYTEMILKHLNLL